MVSLVVFFFLCFVLEGLRVRCGGLWATAPFHALFLFFFLSSFFLSFFLSLSLSLSFFLFSFSLSIFLVIFFLSSLLVFLLSYLLPFVLFFFLALFLWNWFMKQQHQNIKLESFFHQSFLFLISCLVLSLKSLFLSPLFPYLKLCFLVHINVLIVQKKTTYKTPILGEVGGCNKTFFL